MLQHEAISLVGAVVGVFGFFLAYVYMKRASKLEDAVIEVIEQNDFLKSECAKFHSNLDRARKINAELEFNRATLIKKDTENHKKINDLDIILESKNYELKKILANASTSKNEATAQVNTSELRLNETCQKLKTAVNQIQALKKDNMELTKINKAAEIAELRSDKKLVATMSDLDKSQNKVSELEKVVAAKETEITQKNETVQSLQELLDLAKNDLQKSLEAESLTSEDITPKQQEVNIFKTEAKRNREGWRRLSSFDFQGSGSRDQRRPLLCQTQPNGSVD